MVEPYVEALRFMTPMGFDVLTFTIIERLAGSGALAVAALSHHSHLSQSDGVPCPGKEHIILEQQFRWTCTH